MCLWRKCCCFFKLFYIRISVYMRRKINLWQQKVLLVFCFSCFPGRWRYLPVFQHVNKQVFLFARVRLLTDRRMVMLLICGRCFDKEVDIVFTARRWVGTLISTCRTNKPTNYPLRGKTSPETRRFVTHWQRYQWSDPCRELRGNGGRGDVTRLTAESPNEWS